MFCVMCSSGVHDIGGLEEEFGPIDTREYGYQLWEMQVHTFTRMLILAQAVNVPVELVLRLPAMLNHMCT